MKQRSVLILALPALLACQRPSPAAPPQSSGDGDVILVPNPTVGCDDIARCDEACQTGSADDCRKLGNAYEAGQGVGADEARAAQLFVRACDLGNSIGCAFAGRMYEYAHGVAKDDAHAAALYQKSCDQGSLTGCYNQAIMLENGRGIAKDLAQAYALYTKVCGAGASAGCEGADRLRAAVADGRR